MQDFQEGDLPSLWSCLPREPGGQTVIKIIFTNRMSRRKPLRSSVSLFVE